MPFLDPGALQLIGLDVNAGISQLGDFLAVAIDDHLAALAGDIHLAARASPVIPASLFWRASGL
jgi:hypothetical protein